MISISCTNCKATLEMDDAFAGGVCRCRFCGTIQTVPAKSPRGAAAAGAAPKSGKAIYHKRPGGDAAGAGAAVGTGSGTGLDELADAVASSGLPSSGLAGMAGGVPGRPGRRNGQAVAAAALPGTEDLTSPVLPYRAPVKGNSQLAVFLGVAVGLVVAALLGVIAYLLLARGSAPVPAPVTAGGSSGGTPAVAVAPAAVSGPSFAGVALADAPSVVYVLDRSWANEEVFDTLKATTYRSIESLGPRTTFQVILWEHKDAADNVAFPENGVGPATPQNIAACKDRLETEVAFGNTTPDRAMALAAAQRPAVIILASAKGLSLDRDSALGAVDAALAGSSTKVHTFALGQGDESPVLREIAQRYGGQYRQLPLANLRKFSF